MPSCVRKWPIRLRSMFPMSPSSASIAATGRSRRRRRRRPAQCWISSPTCADRAFAAATAIASRGVYRRIIAIALAGMESGTMAIVSNGDRILVIDKRLFKDDNTRLFVGIVEEFANDAIRARGFSYHVSPYEVSGAERRGEERVRVITLAAGDVIFVLPAEQDLTRLQLKRSPKSMQLTDGVFAMDLSDFMLRV